MLKYVSKFAMDILPSVVATILGAYIVNHYINAKPATDVPAAAMSSIDSKKANARNGAKPAQPSTDVANIPEPGVRARGISEKTILDRSAVEKPVAEKPVAEKPVAEKPVPVVEKPAEKPADKPTETASIPVEVKRPQPAPREKAVAKAAPVVAAPTTAAPVEAAVAPEEHRDANDLARAAIERLRGTTEASRAQEAARAPETSRVVSAPPMTPIRPLPPPIMVSSPAAETVGPTAGPLQARPPYEVMGRSDDPRRPTPPADIPDSRPLDLRAEAAVPATHEHTTVAEDVLSAAKSVFHAVLPNNSAK